MGEAAFDLLAPFSGQGLAALAGRGTRRFDHGGPGFRCQSIKIAAEGMGIADDGAHPQLMLEEVQLRRIVKAFVGGDGFDARAAFLRWLSVQIIHEFRGFDDTSGGVLTVARITGTDFGGDDGPAVQIHDVLRFIQHVAGSMLGAADFGVRIRRVVPLGIGGFAALPAAVKLVHRSSVIRVHPGGPGQLPDIIALALCGVAHRAAQAGIGFHVAAVDSQIHGRGLS